MTPFAALALAVTIALTGAPPLAAQGFAPDGVNYIVAVQPQRERSYIDLSIVRSEVDGMIEVVDPATGRVLGQSPVNAGANANVRVRLNTTARSGIVALLRQNGEIVATRPIRIIDREFLPDR